MSTDTPVATRPWHREPMVWLTISIPALTVVAGIVTLWIAMSHGDDTVGPTMIEQIAQPAAREP